MYSTCKERFHVSVCVDVPSQVFDSATKWFVTSVILGGPNISKYKDPLQRLETPDIVCTDEPKMSRFPCYFPSQTLVCTFDALTSSQGIFYETLLHHATHSGWLNNALHSTSIPPALHLCGCRA